MNLIDEYIDENHLSKLLQTSFKLNSELIKKSFNLVKTKNNNGYQPSIINTSYSSKFNEGACVEIIKNAINSINSSDPNFPYLIDTQTNFDKCDDENNDKK